MLVTILCLRLYDGDYFFNVKIGQQHLYRSFKAVTNMDVAEN